MKRALLGLAIVIMLGLGSAASASTITFETAPIGGGFSGPITENGFTYSDFSGGLFVSGNHGNPGRDMEGTGLAGGGVLDIVRAGGGVFTFASTDYAAIDSRNQGSQTLTVNGYLAGSLVGTDTFILANTNVQTPIYANWTTELASQLAGLSIDDLQFVLAGAGEINVFVSFEAIDNVTLTTSVPEPAPLVLIFTALVILGLVRRPAANLHA
jgi:hypothetical protein